MKANHFTPKMKKCVRRLLLLAERVDSRLCTPLLKRPWLDNDQLTSCPLLPKKLEIPKDNFDFLTPRRA
jgi:hypothetical protein